MGIPHYLAMTAAELSQNPASFHTAWLACHFSPYHSGLSNLPGTLPEGPLLVLDDATPIENHDPKIVAQQVSERIADLKCTGLLLDFQRSNNPQAQDMAAYLVDALPFPVGVSHLYAKELGCPVFLPPAPLHQPLDNYFASWKGRDIWLETALSSEILTLTKDGCTISPALKLPLEGFIEAQLHCHYRIETGTDFAKFTLWRTQEELADLLTEAETLGATLAVGLWQELGML